MTLAAAPRRKQRIASPPPQVAPPLPLIGELAKYQAAAEIAGITLMSWQELTARYMTATSKSGWRFPEVAVVVPRQNGKTTLLIPRIVAGLLAGEKIMHTAQNREFPREIFGKVADVLDPGMMRHPPRFASGQERIDMLNGGIYRIVAPSRGGARGPSNDLVIIDEAREFEDFDYVAAARPTLTVSERPQILYLSNAGSDISALLNSLRRRAGKDEDFCYLEWSAPSQYAVDDREGWKIANPALGSKPQIMDYLEREYRTSLASGTLSLFETEHLCRWVISMQPKLVRDEDWMACAASIDSDPVRPAIAFNMDPSGKRASAAMSWQLEDGRIALVELTEATGNPIDVKALGEALQALKVEHRARKIGYAAWTDKDLARYVPDSQPIDSKEFAAASENFARLVASRRLAWDGASHVGDDLGWTSRKRHDESQAWMAVPSSSERSVTAVLAAIRATWLASAPKPAVPRIG